MKSNILVNTVLLCVVMSCNGQSDKKKDMNSNNVTPNKVSVKSNKKADLSDISFDNAIDKTLSVWGMSLADDGNESTNLNLDYEEFIMKAAQPVQYSKIDLSNKFKDFSIFYDKKTKIAFSYEIKITDKEAADEVIKLFKEKYSKPAFFKEQDSKAGTIFFDENGNEVENLKQSFYQWNDAKSHTSFYVVEKKGPQTEVTITAIDNSSKRLKEWTSFRSLDMVFPTK